MGGRSIIFWERVGVRENESERWRESRGVTKKWCASLTSRSIPRGIFCVEKYHPQCTPLTPLHFISTRLFHPLEWAKKVRVKKNTCLGWRKDTGENESESQWEIERANERVRESESKRMRERMRKERRVKERENGRVKEWQRVSGDFKSADPNCKLDFCLLDLRWQPHEVRSRNLCLLFKNLFKKGRTRWKKSDCHQMQKVDKNFLFLGG